MKHYDKRNRDDDNADINIDTADHLHDKVNDHASDDDDEYDYIDKEKKKIPHTEDTESLNQCGSLDQYIYFFFWGGGKQKINKNKINK